jgi:uncharacterized protein YqgC (DUF456 family)
MMETIALIIAIIFFLIGILGTLLPALPGVVLVFTGMVVYGFMTKFVTLGVWFFLMQLLVMVLVFIVDFFASAVSSNKYGGSKQAAFGAVLGSIFGIVVMGPLGIILGPFIGSVAAEILLGRDLKQAIRVGFGSLVGVLGGTVFKLAAEILMITYFFMTI